MPKVLPPGIVSIPGVEKPFIANAVPDVFDERDFEYRPRLEPLPPRLDKRDADKAFFVMLQKGNSCTGHAVASVINVVLARIIRKELQEIYARKRGRRPEPTLPRVSPYMLYRLARRYDEFAGEEDLGSSLRGAFKGWFNHGVCLVEDWSGPDTEPDLDNPVFINQCRARPLGAFYRVNPFRLDDMQSAISELDAIAVSALIHDGWIKPVVMRGPDGSLHHIIQRKVNSKPLGGHAFALVGYNEIGFLVQNSWGDSWGKKGFATLPYEDWLQSAYDAWVARPGVPQTPFAGGWALTHSGTAGSAISAPGPDLNRLSAHVVNLGNDGRLSDRGKFRSTPEQIERIFQNMERWHEVWFKRSPGVKHHIVFYAHGGCVSEKAGLQLAENQLNWWLNNQVYPVFFAWQSGPLESLHSHLVDMLKGRLPAGGIGDDLVEQFDRLVEKFARQNVRWIWDEMKENARGASERINDLSQVRWPPTPEVSRTMNSLPGASLVALRLAKYIQKHGAENVAIHLSGHSAGSIFHAAFLQRLVEAGISVESLALMAPGIRVDEYLRDVFPYQGKDKPLKRVTIFNLSDSLELDDVVGQGNLNIYRKSLLYLVSRALERPTKGDPNAAFEIPLMGMEKFFYQPVGAASKAVSGNGIDPNKSLKELLGAAGGSLVISQKTGPSDSRSESTNHGGFDNDPATMTAVLLRALGLKAAREVNNFREHAELIDRDVLTAVSVPHPEKPEEPAAPAAEEAFSFSMPGDGAAMPMMAAGIPTLEEAAAPAEAKVEAPQEPDTAQEAVPEEAALSAEVSLAPRSGSPTIDVLQSFGYVIEEDGGEA